MRAYKWTEYGVQLAGTVAPAANRDEALDYRHGWPVCRAVTCTPVGKGGDADVDIGPWVKVVGAP